MESELQDGMLLVKLPQHFAGPAVRDAMALVHEEYNRGALGCIFEFCSCELIDSSGIGTLVSLAKESKTRGVRLALRNLHEDLFQLFVDTGLDKVFEIEKDNRIKVAEIDLFETSIDIRLDLKFDISGDVCIFAMSGVMNHPLGSRYFKQQFLLSMAQNRKILLDFEELTFFDSLSISAVLNMNKLLRETGGSMRLCGANYIVADLFSTLNIDSIIPVFHSREEALQDWT